MLPFILFDWNIWFQDIFFPSIYGRNCGYEYFLVASIVASSSTNGMHGDKWTARLFPVEKKKNCSTALTNERIKFSAFPYRLLLLLLSFIRFFSYEVIWKSISSIRDASRIYVCVSYSGVTWFLFHA